MAARPFKSLFQGAGRNALDLPVAGLAALAAGFAAFAVPQDLLSRMVTATGLPSILSAAQPPLGLTARVAIAVIGAAIVFGLVFLLLRLLDRSGMNAVEAKADEEAMSPRVRRRDGHPDAPAPRPISAARDLGEPAPPRAPLTATPPWRDEAEPAAAPVAEMAPELAPEPEPAFKPTLFVEPTPAADAPEPELEPEFEPEPAAEIWPAQEPEPEPVAELWQAPEVEPEPVPEIVAEALPVAEPAPPPAPSADMPNSIAELMERLEQGLARRRMIDPRPAATPVPATPPEVFPEAPEAPDDRLQSAIASLQRLAARSS